MNNPLLIDDLTTNHSNNNKDKENAERLTTKDFKDFSHCEAQRELMGAKSQALTSSASRSLPV